MWQEQAIQRSRCDGGRLYDLHQELFGKWILLSPQKLGGGAPTQWTSPRRIGRSPWIS